MATLRELREICVETPNIVCYECGRNDIASGVWWRGNHDIFLCGECVPIIFGKMLSDVLVDANYIQNPDGGQMALERMLAEAKAYAYRGLYFVERVSRRRCR